MSVETPVFNPPFPTQQAGPGRQAVFDVSRLVQCVAGFRSPQIVVRDPSSGHLGVIPSPGAELQLESTLACDSYQPLAWLAPLYPEWLGDRAFNERHGVRFPYIVGEMAQGISSVPMVIASATNGLLAVFGAGGLAISEVEDAILKILSVLGPKKIPWAINLIHTPQEPHWEEQAVVLFLKYGVSCVSASAYLRLEKTLVRYALHGLHRDANGNIVRPNRVIAKVSRPEVAAQFMSPAPAAMVRDLLAAGQISEQEAQLAAYIPVAEDVTAEADSGGHTDNRPLISLLPILLQMSVDLQRRHGYTRAVRIGAAGGLATPEGVAGAFAMGAAYVVTGTINQCTQEAGQSFLVKQMLAQQDLADVTMAPAADMFEMGVKLQVARRGTLFAQRAQRLYDCYRRYDSLEQIPAAERLSMEKEVLGASLAEVWSSVEQFWQQRHPPELERARTDAKHRMALSFRWYLGMSSHWARQGASERQSDFQIWCGPAMGAFNRWCQDSFLAAVENRSVVQIAMNLLEGAACVTRAQQLRSYGLPLPAQAFCFKPRPFHVATHETG